MKKIILFFILVSFFKINAQKKIETNCSSDLLHLKFLKEDLFYKKQFEKNADLWQKKYLETGNDLLYRNSSLTTTETLNVVFHDILGGSTGQGTALTAAQINTVVSQLNGFFNGSLPADSPSGIDSMIQFCLSTRNLNGDTTPSPLTYNNTVAGNIVTGNLDQMAAIVNTTGATVSPVYAPFPTSKYVNIYVVDSIEGPVAGFATLPSIQNSNNKRLDGIYIERSMLDGNLDKTKVLVHEMGHYLGLFHVFGICDPFTTNNPVIANACSCDNVNPLFNGDMVADTPPSTLIINNCDITSDTCPSPGLDDKTNYMDYSLQSCQNHFTAGQITRMQFMIDPDNGVRKELLGNIMCENCSQLNQCTFTITPSQVLATIPTAMGIGTINTLPAGTVVNFSTTTNGTCGANVAYTWVLTSLENFIPAINVTGNTFSTPNNLVPGNYHLLLTAALTSNSNCTEIANYSFMVLPVNGVCNVTNPSINGDGTDNWATFNRISFSNGWTRQNTPPYNYVNGQQPHYSNTGDSQFVEEGFDIIPLSPGGVLPDSNFSGVTLPLSAGINSVFRVGKTTEYTSNSAYYAKVTIPVNQNNCKYRIWYIGSSDGNGETSRHHPLTSNFKSPTMGFKTLLNYNSPVNTITSVNNSSWGSDENGPFNFFSPTLTIRNLYKEIYKVDYNTGGSMNQWRFRDIDLSQFINLSEDVDAEPTEATFTFFAHTNETQGDSFLNAYGYFAIECLGGGIPELFTFDVPDLNMPCSSPYLQNKVKIDLPKAPYFNTELPFSLTNPFLNFADIDLYKKNENTGLWDIMQNSIVSYEVSTKGAVEFSVSDLDAPFATYKLVYKTLHQTITNEFRVFVGFYNSLNDCTTGDKIDTTFYPSTYYCPTFIENNKINIFTCTSQTVYPELHLTPTCIEEPHTYKWFRNGDLLPNETSASLQLNSSNFRKEICRINKYTRKILYTEPYCGNQKEKGSDEFELFSNTFKIKPDNAGFITQDVCYGNDYEFRITNLLFETCNIPTGFGLNNIENTLTLQLFTDNNILLGNTHTITFNGAFNSISYAQNLVFSFNTVGMDAIYGTNLFSTHQLGMHITGTYLGCPIDFWQSAVTSFNFRPSAVGGSIGYNCNNNTITSITNGTTFNNSYSWEFAIGNGNFTSLTGVNTNTSSLGSAIVNNLLSSYPNQHIHLRRISIGFPLCLQSAMSNVITIIPNPPSTIVFTNLPTTYCASNIPLNLPLVSTNGITGNWGTYPTQVGQHTITFIADAGYCLQNPVFNYVFTIVDNLVPVFNTIPAVCSGTYVSLPSISENNVTGTWSPDPATTLLTANTTFTFTPSGNNCATNPIAIIIKVNPTITPVFDLPNAICYGNIMPELPTISTNGITGTWQPSEISATESGTYVFTPTNNLCSNPYSITITILTDCAFALYWSSDVGCETADPYRKYSADISDGECIKACEGSTVTYYLTNNPSVLNVNWQITGGLVIDSANYFCTVKWVDASFASLQGQINLANGAVVNINKCIEKINGPNALFSVNSQNIQATYQTCTGVEVIFENLSSDSNGNSTLYYTWNFGDGSFSNLFEPQHVYLFEGTYNVQLTVSNGCSCISSYTVSLRVRRNSYTIDCPTVVCEGDSQNYSINLLGGCNTINWVCEGGTIITPSTTNQVAVLWNNVDDSGFGYLYASSPNCLKCVLPVKIPVVKQNGTIVGDEIICTKSQSTYRLPQWPSTVYNWSIENNVTDALLINNDTGNEVIVNSGSSGEIALICTYFNTLLNCGGTAKFIIQVIYPITFSGEEEACVGNSYHYNALDDYGATIPTIDWTITGPDNFSQSGTTGSFDFSFPTIGIYYISLTTSNSNSCSFPKKITVTNAPTPAQISGPLVICPGNEILYTCPFVFGQSILWTVTNGTIQGSATDTTVKVIFDSLATAPYTIGVTYSNGECSNTPLIVTVEKDIPQFSIIAPNTQVCGSSTENYATDYLDADTFEWSIIPNTAGSVQTGQNSNQVSIVWNQPVNGSTTQASIELKIRKCGVDYIQTKEITVISHPDILINGPQTTCDNQTANFNFTMSQGNYFSTATWNFGDGTPPVTVFFNETNNPFAISHVYASNITTNTSYQVTLTVSGGNGCVGTATSLHTIIVSPTPVVTLNLPTNYNLCEDSPNTSYNASVNIQSGFAYTTTVQWYRNNTAIAAPFGTQEIINVSSIANGFGTGTYYAIVTNSLGCTKQTNNFTIYNNCNNGNQCNCNLEGQAQVTSCNTVAATITVAGCTPLSTTWTIGTNGVTTSNNSLYYCEFNNLTVGSHTIYATVTFINTLGQNCTRQITIPVIVPYTADLRYTATCNPNNSSYTLTLLDHSVKHPSINLINYSFTLDGGTNWYNGSAIGGINQYNLPNLAPGIYNVGIKINDGLHQDCTKFITINLPSAPSSAFTFEQNQCSTEPVHFYATNTAPGLQYHWFFEPQAENLLPNPVRVYSNGGEKEVTLRVTNAFGCYTETTQSVFVLSAGLAGTITPSPNSACQGESITLNYEPLEDQIMPTNIIWYKDNATTPIASGPASSITVTQGGYYFVYVASASGCHKYDNDPVTVSFITAPEKPTLDGQSTICLGSSNTISITSGGGTSNQWSLDGVPQPQWNNATSITHTPPQLGTYVYSVIGSVGDGQGNFCTGEVGAFEVTVIQNPDIPSIEITNVGCTPYSVELAVTNPQAGINYYWSNGQTGTTATATHDGPIRVRAESLLCSTSSQIDLPRNINALQWTFPDGCFTVCKKNAVGQLGYITPPLGTFDAWKWYKNTTIVSQNYDTSIDNSPIVTATNSYSLYLANEYCAKTFSSAMVTEVNDCEDCKIRITPKDIERKFAREGSCFYSITFEFINTSPTTSITGVLTAANGIGYFENSSITLSPGTSYATYYFYPLNGFNGGTGYIMFNGFRIGKKCLFQFPINFPSCDAPRPALVDNNESANFSITLAPNPAQDYTDVSYIATGSETLTSLQVVDMLGRTITEIRLNPEDKTVRIDTATWASGHYLILAKTNEAVVQTLKLIVGK
jgi:hypothetical protein